jgi:hypothetical protein
MADATPRPPSAAPHLVALADDVFARTSPYAGDGFRHHCQRLARFATMLMRARGIEFDEDLAYLLAMVHDLGIVSERDEGVNYLQRSRALFQRETAGVDLGEVEPTVLDECLLYNHRLLPVPNLSGPAECFRQAVIMEHARGLVRYGLPRTEVRAVFQELPRDNFDRVLLDFTWRTIRREPITLFNGVFFGGRA